MTGFIVVAVGVLVTISVAVYLLLRYNGEV